MVNGVGWSNGGRSYRLLICNFINMIINNELFKMEIPYIF